MVRGASRGRAIGFPTANLRPDAELVPKGGIYATRAHVLDDGRRWPCALSIGTNPTFVDGGAQVVEAHLLGFDGDLYGRRLRLEFVQRLRDEQRFDSVDALVAQIREDVARTRELVS